MRHLKSRCTVRKVVSQLGAGVGSDFSRLCKGLDKASAKNYSHVQSALIAHVELAKANKVPRLEAADVNALVTILRSGVGVDLQSFAIEGIVQLGPQANHAASPLAAFIRTRPNRNLLSRSLVAMEAIDVRTEEVIGAFEGLIDHDDSGIKDQAALAILRLAPDRVQIKVLIDLTGRSNEEIVTRSSKLLRQKLANVSPKDLPFLRIGLKNPSTGSRLAFINAIGSLKEGGRDASPDLVAFFQSKDKELIRHVVRALNDLGTLMATLNETTDPMVLAISIAELRELQLKNQETLQLFERNLSHKEDEVRDAAASAILNLGPERLEIKQLKELTGRPREEIRLLARKLLVQKTQVVASTVGSVKVELVDGSLKKVPYFRQTLTGPKDLETAELHLVLKVRVSNRDFLRAIKYVPWHSLDEKKSLPTAKDEHELKLAPWLAGPGSYPVGGFQKAAKIDPEKSVVDVVALTAPKANSLEIDIKLPAENLGMPGQWFVFKVGRPFFEKK